MSVDLTSVSDDEFFAELHRRSNLDSDPLSYVFFSANEDLLPVLEEEFDELSHLSDEQREDVAKKVMTLMRSKFTDRLSSVGNEMISAQISYNLDEALNQLGLSKNAPGI